jgi:hypothetical protein
MAYTDFDFRRADYRALSRSCLHRTLANKSERNLSGHPIFYHGKIYWREMPAENFIDGVTTTMT